MTTITEEILEISIEIKKTAFEGKKPISKAFVQSALAGYHFTAKRFKKRAGDMDKFQKEAVLCFHETKDILNDAVTLRSKEIFATKRLAKKLGTALGVYLATVDSLVAMNNINRAYAGYLDTVNSMIVKALAQLDIYGNVRNHLVRRFSMILKEKRSILSDSIFMFLQGLIADFRR